MAAWCRSTDDERGLWAAAVALAATTVFTSAVAVREDLPGRPLGVGVPLSVPAAILVGWGAGVAMPWPMAASALVAARRARSHPRAVTPAAVCAAVGLGGLVGILVEPDTYGRRRSSHSHRTAVVAHVLASAALAATALRRVSRRGRRSNAAASAA